MRRYVIAPRARLDLLEIEDYIITNDSLAAARQVVADFQAGIERIAEMPGLGHKHEAVQDESLRVWCVHSWLVVYRHETRPIEIVRVLSGYRDLGRLL